MTLTRRPRASCHAFARSTRLRLVERIAIIAFAFVAVLFGGLRTAQAGGDLDIAKALARPGVKLVAVEFYATWCEPCMKAMPRWKALAAQHHKDGLRVVVVNTGESDGGCKAVDWAPDEFVCDLSEALRNAYGAKDLPAAFLWSWEGNLLVNHGDIAEVERAVTKYEEKAPHVRVEAAAGVDAAVTAAVGEALLDQGKIQLVAADADRELLEDAKRKSQDARYAEKYSCEAGQEVPANGVLKVSRMAQGESALLSLALLDVTTGCQRAQATAAWTSDPREAAREAVAKLLQKLGRPEGLQLPFAGFAAPLSLPGARRADKILNPEFRNWKPTSVDPVLVTFESTPAGARVELDGATLCASTASCKKPVEPGVHVVRMSANRFVTREEEVRIDEDLAKVAWTLESNTGTVTIDTGAITGVPIVVDDEPAGVSPLRLELLAGPHRIAIADPCYEAARADIAVERGASKQVAFNGVIKMAGLRVESMNADGDAEDARVVLDNAFAGQAWKMLQVPACAKAVRVETATQEWTGSVSLRPYETSTLSVRMSAKKCETSHDIGAGVSTVTGVGLGENIGFDLLDYTAELSCARHGVIAGAALGKMMDRTIVRKQVYLASGEPVTVAPWRFGIGAGYRYHVAPWFIEVRPQFVYQTATLDMESLPSSVSTEGMDSYKLRGLGYRAHVAVGTRHLKVFQWRLAAGWEQVWFDTVLTPPTTSTSGSSSSTSNGGSSSPDSRTVASIAAVGAFVTSLELGFVF